MLRRKMGCCALPSGPTYEKRYPYLDRDLIEFLFAIPREQLVRPGHRRSLMRRALTGTVPDAILNRKRKAYVARGGMAVLSSVWPRGAKESGHFVTADLGIVDPRMLSESLQNALNGQGTQIVILLRTLWIEFWLRDLGKSKAISRHAGDGPFALSSDSSKRVSPLPYRAAN
jgi:asparagine synthase (glutamine-hydrolysing)